MKRPLSDIHTKGTCLIQVSTCGGSTRPRLLFNTVYEEKLVERLHSTAIHLTDGQKVMKEKKGNESRSRSRRHAKTSMNPIFLYAWPKQPILWSEIDLTKT